MLSVGPLFFPLLLLITGCATSSGLLVERWYMNDAKGIIAPLPGEYWELVSQNGTRLAFRHRVSSAGILLNTTCGRDEHLSLPLLTRHLFFGFEQKEILEQEEVKIQGIPALKSLLRAELQGMPLQIASYVIRYRSCVYDFVYYAHPQDFATGLPDFERMVREVRLIPQEG
ncbi:MAG: hypothetical protein D6736_03260 [Nitrospinota bacterium]|nr:MAG: hypothetical protein D6736_03260 [Nitrospinota bacterium]